MDDFLGKNGHAVGTPPLFDERDRKVILQELQRVLESRQFGSSKRSKQFLSYVVLKSLEGAPEDLKERVIGAHLYNREIGYATGDDPVVRIHAGEVRRRLEQYYYQVPPETVVRIDVPRGSYSPEFHWLSTVAIDSPAPAEPVPVIALPPHESAPPEQPVPASPSPLLSRRWILAAALALFVLIMAGYLHRQSQLKSPADLFWAASNTNHPVLICLAKSVAYRPSLSLYEDYARNHPGTFQTEVERLSRELPLDPNENVPWKDIQMAPDLGIGTADVYAAVSIENYLVQRGRLAQVRIGNNYSFEDLRTSPAVMIGAYNNRWTMEMAANLHFAFQWPPTSMYPKIKEMGGAGREWTSEVKPHLQYDVDYGVVTRLVDSNTGQLLISAAGLGPPGTQAAGELISNSQELDGVLEALPKEWNKKNVQIVVRTNVIDSLPGPPRVVAVYVW